MFIRFPNGLSVAAKGYNNPTNVYLASRVALGRRDIVIPLKYTDGTGTNTTNFKIPANCVIIPEPFLFIRTAEATGATKTLSVGITGTVGAFISGLSAATAGLVQPTLLDAAVTLGSDLFVYGGATSTAPTRQAYINATGSPIAVTWTPGSADWANFDADLILPMYQFADLTQTPVNVALDNIDLGG